MTVCSTSIFQQTARVMYLVPDGLVTKVLYLIVLDLLILFLNGDSREYK